MAAPIIKIKRSSVPGKIPTTVSLPVGEFGINTYDGKVYIQQDQGGVGVGSTVIVVNPWSVGLGSDTYNTYFNSGNVGIGTTNPTSKLHVVGVVSATSFIGDGSQLTGITATAKASVTISETAPVDPEVGDMWYSSLLGRTFVYYTDVNSSQWVDAAPFNIAKEVELTPGKTSSTIVATEGQTIFTVSYIVGYIDVFLNGVRLNSSEYVGTSGTNIILMQPASVNDVLDVVEYTLGIGATGATGPTGPAAQLTIGGRVQAYTTNVSDVGVEILLRTGISTATI